MEKDQKRRRDRQANASYEELCRQNEEADLINLEGNYYLLLLCSPDIMSWWKPDREIEKLLYRAGYSKKMSRHISLHSHLFRCWPMARGTLEQCEKQQKHAEQFGLKTKIVYKDVNMKIVPPPECLPNTMVLFDYQRKLIERIKCRPPHLWLLDQS